MFRRLRMFIYGLGLGAGAMYLYDPEEGNRRRAMLRDQTIRSLNRTEDTIDKGSRDLSNRASGMIADMRSLLTHEQVSDETLAQRVRSKLGGAGIVSHPRALNVTAQNGKIILSGPILADEVTPLLARVSSLRGVRGVENQLEVHQEPGDVPALQGAPAGSNSARMRGVWTPGLRLLAASAGSMLTLSGMRRGGLMGTVRSAFGLGLLARGVTNRSWSHLVGLSGDAGAVTIHKGIKVNAPVEEVFGFWRNFANFPRFMSNVYEVHDLGNGRSHWTVAGPPGTPVEWDATITNIVPNQMIAWESVPGSQIMQAGLVRFAPAEERATHLNVQMSYTPPAGVLGHAVASFFGVNPKQSMDEDLVRFKSLIERGKTSTDTGTVTREQVESPQPQPASQTTEHGRQSPQQARSEAHRPVSTQGFEGQAGGQGETRKGQPSGAQGSAASRGQTPGRGGNPPSSMKPGADMNESGQPGGGAGRTDQVGDTGVYPASDMDEAPEDAELHGMASWGQGERGAAGYEDSGSSELTGLGEETDLGSVIPGPDEEPDR